MGRCACQLQDPWPMIFFILFFPIQAGLELFPASQCPLGREQAWFTGECMQQHGLSREESLVALRAQHLSEEHLCRS